VQVDDHEDPKSIESNNDVHIVDLEAESNVFLARAVQPQSITQFLSLSLVTRTRCTHQSEARVNINKSHVLTSDECIHIVEQKTEHKEAVERANLLKRFSMRKIGRSERMRKFARQIRDANVKKSGLRRSSLMPNGCLLQYHRLESASKSSTNLEHLSLTTHFGCHLQDAYPYFIKTISILQRSD
jgi:hypothetical protein